MAQHCTGCSKDLTSHPKIQIAGGVYCYICAKGVARNQDYKAEQELVPKLEVYKSQLAECEAWKDALNAALPSPGTQKFIVVGIIVGFFLLLGGPKKVEHVFPMLLLGSILGLIVNHCYVQSKRKEWIQKNPQPEYPSQPSREYARSQIELVGATRGRRQIPGDYRREILERDGYRCQSCGKVLPEEQLEVHHIKSRADRGKNYADNLITLCFDCHLDEDWFGHYHYMRKWYRKGRR